MNELPALLDMVRQYPEEVWLAHTSNDYDIIRVSNSTQYIENMAYVAHELYKTTFVVNLILVPILAILGVIGNVITVIILSKDKKTSTNLYLKSLAISDMLYLIIAITDSIRYLPGMTRPQHWHYWVYYRYASWIGGSFDGTSKWLTVSFTIERFIQVRYPLKGRVLCTLSNAKKTIVIIPILCFLLNATDPHDYTTTLVTTLNVTRVDSIPSDLGNVHIYFRVKQWFYLLVFTLLPLILLVVFNTLIMREVHRSNARRGAMTGDSGNRGSAKAEENKITVMLVSVVLVAISCETMRFAIIITMTTVSNNVIGTPSMWVINFLSEFQVILSCVNAASNFIFYNAFGEKFRKAFLLMFFTKWYNGANEKSVRSFLSYHCRCFYWRRKWTPNVGVAL